MKARSVSTTQPRSRSRSTSTARRSASARAPRSRTAAPARTRQQPRPLTFQLSRSAIITIHREEIRRWAEARDGMPAVVTPTHRPEEPEGILRIDFPGFSGGRTLQQVSWEEWFQIFDKHKLAFLYEEYKAKGGLSTFNKLVRRSEFFED